jgi:hypothetical protein
LGSFFSAESRGEGDRAMIQFAPLIAVAGVALALWTANDLARHWGEFWDDRVQQADRVRATRVSFFLLIPLGVLLHEVGHALAVWQLGGEVVEFNWSFLAGYVVPRGQFSTLGLWWIYLSGNLVSIGLAMVALLVAPLPLAPMVRYLALTFGRQELYFSLLGYPLLSLGSADGDWVGIYGIPPLPVKVALAVVHVGLLAGAWWLGRLPAVRRWELTLDRRAEQVIAGREAEMTARPGDVRPRLKLAAFYVRRGEMGLAEQAVRDALRIDPNHPDALVAAGSLADHAQRGIEAAGYYERALHRLPMGRRRALVARALGQLNFRLDRPREAVEAYTEAINSAGLAEAYYWRGRAHLRLRDESAAVEDFRRAAQVGQGEIARLAAEELQTLTRARAGDEERA